MHSEELTLTDFSFSYDVAVIFKKNEKAGMDAFTFNMN